ncbi:hypothetical protein [Aggregatilinea lenta]|uniref:hypothetical protein n=1 Tax=Aggregatilinea lenta TaxID=913108 RepID=UPI000E5A5AF8|nr:hypothetical protein [Aggregatilinea lenta]
MKTEKPASAKLWYTTASDTRFDSMVMEARIGDEYFAVVFYEDNAWRVNISALSSKGVELDWEDFADLFCKFSIFISKETRGILEDTENNLENALEELEALREEKKKGFSASEEK